MISRRSFSWYLLGLFLLSFVLVIYVPQNLQLLVMEKATYLPVHTFLEFIGIFTSLGIFILGWATYKNVGSQKILFLSISSLAVACFDFAHTLSFAGMPQFVTESSPNKAIYFWLAGRLTDAVAFLFVALPLRHVEFKKWRWPGLVISMLWVILVYAAVLYWPDSLPLMFVKGQGLTPLKIFLEWAAIILSLIAAGLFFNQWRTSGTKIKADLSNQLMTCGCVLFAMGGLLFCLYRDVDDLYNLFGHIYKTLAFIYIFAAIFLVCVKQPYDEMQRLSIEARTASESKSRFLANVSHEFRTPLGVISGFSELLQTKELDADATDWVNTIHRNSDQLRFMIDDLLDLTKAESGSISLTPAVFSPRSLVTEVVQGLEILAGNKGVVLNLQLAANVPPEVKTDDLRLRQILVNIIGNAVKFTPQGQVNVSVQNNAPNKLQFSVQDSGVGISKESTSFLFRPFSQVDDSFTRRFGGTGLGLALSKKLAQLLDGDLWLEKSEPGVGSTFVFTVSYETANHSAVGTPVVEGALPSLKGLRILAAEDSSDIRFLLAHYLKDSEAEVSLVDNGLKAVKALKADGADILLMDIQMPDMDGLTATQEIRSAGWKGPIIAMTAHAHEAERTRALSSGFDEYLVKPFRKSELIRLLAKTRDKTRPS